MDLKDVKIFIGPVSKNIVDTVIDLIIKEDYKIGLIPSRRQIDWNGGYVNNWNTKTFSQYILDHLPYEKLDNIIIERDHGGIGQGINSDNGTISYYKDALNFPKSTTNIIHVDPWKYYNNFRNSINETIENIKFINMINPYCFFEVGTEESIYQFDESMLNNMLKTLKIELGKTFDKIKYCVIQSGTGLKETKNVGEFDLNRLKNMIKICNNYGILSKEHNGDYLTLDDIKLKFDNGLSAINIAPEFGVYETEILLENMKDYQIDKFFNICYNSNKWCKWVDEDFNPDENRIELMRICGHYQFSDKNFLKMKLNLDNLIKEKLYIKIKNMCEL